MRFQQVEGFAAGRVKPRADSLPNHVAVGQEVVEKVADLLSS